MFTTARDARGIQPGTAITTLVKRPNHDDAGGATVHYRDFWGLASDKRAALLRSLDPLTEAEADAAALLPQGPHAYDELAPPTRARTYKLLPYETTGSYEDWYGIDELFPAREQGVNPNRGLQEKSVVDVDRDTLLARMRAYFDPAVSFEAFAQAHPGLAKKRAGYDPVAVREALRERSAFNADAVEPYVVFPLDARHVYYERSYYADHPDEQAVKLLNRRRPLLGDNLGGNEFLVTVPEARQTSEGLPLLATSLFDLHLHDRGSVGIPAEVDHVAAAVAEDMFTEAKPERIVRAANLFPDVWEHARETFGLDGDLSSPDARTFVRRLFRVTLALLHASAYQDDHRDALSQEWARIPVPAGATVFDRAVALGDQIATLLDPLQNADAIIRAVLGDDRFAALAKLRRVGGGPVRESDLQVAISHFGGSNGGWRPAPDQTDDDSVNRDGALYISEEVYFEHVPEAVWNVEIGGYPVIKKWLGYRDQKRRPGTLSLAEKDHLRSIVRRLAALVALRDSLDAVYADAILDPWTPPEAIVSAGEPV